MSRDGEMENARSECFDLAAAAYSTSQLDLDGFEALAGEIAAAQTLPVLAEIRSRLPEVEQAPPEVPQLVRAYASTVKKVGRWLESSQLDLAATGSKVILDFTAYAFEQNLRISLVVDCKGAEIRLIVPREMDVIERIESTRASVFRDHHRSSGGGGAILITGSLTGSRISIKRRKSK